MKNVIIPFSILIFASCNSKENSIIKTRQQNVAIAKNLFEKFNKHEWQKMADLYADPAYFKDPSFGIDAIKQTRKQTVDKYGGYQSVSPDIHDSISNIYPSEEKYVTVEFISTGTAPDGKKWRIPICTIFKIENGLIISDNTYYDKN